MFGPGSRGRDAGATRCGVLGRYKPFWESAPYDVIRGRLEQKVGVSTEMCAGIDQPTRWTAANAAHLSVTHLGGRAHL